MSSARAQLLASRFYAETVEVQLSNIERDRFIDRLATFLDHALSKERSDALIEADAAVSNALDLDDAEQRIGSLLS